LFCPNTGPGPATTNWPVNAQAAGSAPSSPPWRWFCAPVPVAPPHFVALATAPWPAPAPPTPVLRVTPRPRLERHRIGQTPRLQHGLALGYTRAQESAAGPGFRPHKSQVTPVPVPWRPALPV
jgi:hypothetical protein